MARSWGFLPGWLAAPVLLLVACSGGSSPGRGGTLPVSPPAAPSPSSSAAPTPPKLPAEARKPTTKGAAAFFRYFFDVVNYGYETAESGTLRSLGEKTCSFCSELIHDLDDARSNKGGFTGGQVTVVTAVAAPGNPRQGLLVSAVLAQTEGFGVDATGTTRTSFPARRGLRVDAGVKWTSGVWRMTEVSIIG